MLCLNIGNSRLEKKRVMSLNDTVNQPTCLGRRLAFIWGSMPALAMRISDPYQIVRAGKILSQCLISKPSPCASFVSVCLVSHALILVTGSTFCHLRSTVPAARGSSRIAVGFCSTRGTPEGCQVWHHFGQKTKYDFEAIYHTGGLRVLSILCPR
ncbi:hypothetical protein BKA80DRAFT_265951 [Phyllosticta citrichinensis]